MLRGRRVGYCHPSAAGLVRAGDWSVRCTVGVVKESVAGLEGGGRGRDNQRWGGFVHGYISAGSDVLTLAGGTVWQHCAEAGSRRGACRVGIPARLNGALQYRRDLGLLG